MKVEEKRGVFCFVGFVVLLVSSAVALGVEEEEQPLLAYLVDSGAINLEMADLLRDRCMHELLHTQKTLQDLDFQFVETRTKMRNAGNILFPHVNQILVDCVRARNLLFREISSDPWYEGYFRLLHNLPRRVLAGASGDAPAPSPMGMAPSPSPAPSVPTPVSFFPDMNKPGSPPIAGGDQTSGSASNLNSSDKKTSKRTIVIAVVVTASATLAIVALFFLFCRKCSRSGRKNDERPLLSMSLSEYSIAPPKKSFTSLNEEKPNKFNRNNYPESYSGSTKTDTPISCFQMPPKVPATPALPPLKPPPGRKHPPRPPMPVAPTAPVPPPAPPIKTSSSPAPPPPAPPPVPPTKASSSPAPPPPIPPRPVPHGPKTGPPPPPPPGGKAPPPPPPGGKAPPPPMGLKPPRNMPPGPHNAAAEESEAGGSKAKLKPFFWDKVLANPDHSMVWHQIKSGSFQFNEEMIETLFGYAPPANNKNEAKKESSSQDAAHYIQLIDPKKSQNISILLKALNLTTEEVCDAIQEGNELPPELIQTLMKMAPTSDEELKLRLYSGDLSQLFPAERFLKVLVDIPFAFKRLESLFFMCTLQEETTMLRESFEVLEAACTDLRKSRLFFKLLEAVLKTGNRMNDGTFRGGAQAFKLDTLLKLSDVKGTDGKTTLLHFVVQEIIRSEGIKAAQASQTPSAEDSDECLRILGLQVVSGLGDELVYVKKAAVLDADNLTGTVSRLGLALDKARNFLNSEMKNVPEENGFHQMLRSFVRNAEVDVAWAREEEKRIAALVKSTGDYFHGNSGKDEGLRLFVIVRDFLVILEKVCKEVKFVPPQKPSRPVVAQTSAPDHRQRLFPAIADRRIDSSSSDDES